MTFNKAKALKKMLQLEEERNTVIKDYNNEILKDLLSLKIDFSTIDTLSIVEDVKVYEWDEPRKDYVWFNEEDIDIYNDIEEQNISIKNFKMRDYLIATEDAEFDWNILGKFLCKLQKYGLSCFKICPYEGSINLFYVEDVENNANYNLYYSDEYKNARFYVNGLNLSDECTGYNYMYEIKLDYEISFDIGGQCGEN